MNYDHPEPEWTAENINRQKGDTTFEQCGWCENASCGSVRHGCYLDTRCSLLKEYGLGKDVFWDTVCLIKKLGQKDVESIIKEKERRLETLERQKKDRKNEIKVLKSLPVVDKPPLPGNRTYNYFDVNEVVYVFHDRKWNHGITTPGYRHHDGCISYVIDDYPKSFEKGPWGGGVSRPEVIKEWEAKYFHENIEDMEAWIKLCREGEHESYKMSPEEDYILAMQNLELKKNSEASTSS